MKRFAISLFAIAVLFSFSFAMAQDQTMGGTADKKEAKEQNKEAKAEQKEANAAAKGKAMRLTGWVKTEGDKTMFVNDKDKESWTVQNADMLKAHDGKHVKVKAMLNESDKSLTVEKVTEMRESKQAAPEKKM